MLTDTGVFIPLTGSRVLCRLILVLCSKAKLDLDHDNHFKLHPVLQKRCSHTIAASQQFSYHPKNCAQSTQTVFKPTELRHKIHQRRINMSHGTSGFQKLTLNSHL